MNPRDYLLYLARKAILHISLCEDDNSQICVIYIRFHSPLDFALSQFSTLEDSQLRTA